jgi:hypothetical protein
LDSSCFGDKLKPWLPDIQKLLGDPDDGVRRTGSNLLQRLNTPPSPNQAAAKLRYEHVQNRVEAATTDEGAATLQFRLIAPEVTSERVDVLPNTDKTKGPGQFRVLRQVLLDGSAIARAGINFEPDGQRSISMQFTVAGTRQFEVITASNIHQRLAIVYRGMVLSAPSIQGKVSGGQTVINGNMSHKEIHSIVDCLNHTPAPTDDAWTFTAPRERVLLCQEPTNSARGWLDLDSGILATNNQVDWETRLGHDWISTHNFDLVAAVSSLQLPVLTGFDIVIVPLPASAWDSTTPADVVQSWALHQTEPKQNYKLVASPRKPDTFLFQTREGGKGILQILGITEDGHDVKIRYKLVQTNN